MTSPLENSDSANYSFEFELVEVAAKIRVRRQQLNLGLSDLANTNFSVDYVKRVGKRLTRPSDEFLIYIARRLDLTLTDLLAGPPIKYNQRQAKLAAQELLLHNAYISLQTQQFSDAQSYLARLELKILPPNLLASYYNLKGQLLVNQDQFTEGRAHLEQALHILSDLPQITPSKKTPKKLSGNTANLPTSTSLTIDSPDANGKFDDATKYKSKSKISAAKSSALLAVQALQRERIRNWIGLAFYREQKYQEALSQHKLCLNAIVNGEVKEERFGLQINYNLGNDYFCLGLFQPALDAYKEAARLAVKAEEHTDLAGIYWGLGLVNQRLNQLDEASKYFSQSALLYENLELYNAAINVKGLLGLVLIERTDYKQAQLVLQSALKMIEAQSNSAGPARYDQLFLVQINLAHLYFTMDDLEQAYHLSQAAVEAARSHQNPLALAQSLAQLGRVTVEQGRPIEALPLFEQAEQILVQTGSKTYLTKIYQRWAEALKLTGNIDLAVEKYAAAIKCLEGD